jgi:hypothetical protein
LSIKKLAISGLGIRVGNIAEFPYLIRGVHSSDQHVRGRRMRENY